MRAGAGGGVAPLDGAALRRLAASARAPVWLRLRLPALVAAGMVPLLVPSAHVYDLARVAATYAVLAVGYCIVLGLCGQFSVAHAALYGVGAYTTANLTTQHGASSATALLAAVGFGLLAGALIGLPALRVRGDQLAVITLGIGQVVQLLFLNWTSVTGGFTGISDIPAPSLFGITLTSYRDNYLLAFAALVIVVVAVELLRRSPLGLAFMAVRDDELAARSAGVRTGVCKVSAFALSGAVAGIAGWLYAGAIISISPPTFDVVLSVLVAVMVLLGGQGRVYGAVVGAAIIATLENALTEYPAGEIALKGAAIIAIVMWRAGALRDGLMRLRRA
ncbi:MAG TPA: branched-chain amino acid ABC transporter permease [Candidatus Dormibacteraeota bacterium]|nr:branched-chain amino acid ABC transporter permease [Candidatus Dormibacteraeota bacterium]